MPDVKTVTVTADLATKTLILDGKRASHVAEIDSDPAMRFIQWNLQLSDGQSGSFNPHEPGGPEDTLGFAWTEALQNSLSIFPWLNSKNGNLQLELQDQHSGSSTKGDFHYKLRATINGIVCETNHPSGRVASPGPVMTMAAIPGDPCIRNR